MLTRDQKRALDAYRAVRSVNKNNQEDYKIAVYAFGAEILQCGLAAAMSGLERRENRGDLLREHLANAGIRGLHQPVSATDLPDKIRALDADNYILATREMLQIVRWLTRAIQATFPEKELKQCETS